MNTNLAHYFFRYFFSTSLVVLAAACLFGCGGVLGRYPDGNSEVHGVRASIVVGSGGHAPLDTGLTEPGCSRAAALGSCGPASSTLISIKFEFAPAK